MAYRRGECLALLRLGPFLSVHGLFDFVMNLFGHVPKIDGCGWPPKVALLLHLDAEEVTSGVSVRAQIGSAGRFRLLVRDSVDETLSCQVIDSLVLDDLFKREAVVEP